MTQPLTPQEENFYLMVGKNLRRSRRAMGLTQQALAEAIGIRFQQIQKYECGANRIPLYKLVRICGVLRKPIHHLFFGTPEGRAQQEQS